MTVSYYHYSILLLHSLLKLSKYNSHHNSSPYGLKFIISYISTKYKFSNEMWCLLKLVQNCNLKQMYVSHTN